MEGTVLVNEAGFAGRDFFITRKPAFERSCLCIGSDPNRCGWWRPHRRPQKYRRSKTIWRWLDQLNWVDEDLAQALRCGWTPNSLHLSQARGVEWWPKDVAGSRFSKGLGHSSDIYRQPTPGTISTVLPTSKNTPKRSGVINPRQIYPQASSGGNNFNFWVVFVLPLRNPPTNCTIS